MSSRRNCRCCAHARHVSRQRQHVAPRVAFGVASPSMMLRSVESGQIDCPLASRGPGVAKTRTDTITGAYVGTALRPRSVVLACAARWLPLACVALASLARAGAAGDLE